MADLTVTDEMKVDMECEDIVANRKLGLGCAIEAFKEYEEVKLLINDLQNNYSGVRLEKLCERFMYILKLYQEQPHLLDPQLQSILDMLLTTVRNASSSDHVDLQHSCFKLITILANVRGAKVVVRYLPHEVGDLQLVLKLIDLQDPNDLSTWQSRYVLLIWLSILVLIPFHMDRLDTDQSGTSTIYRIMNTIKDYLCCNDSAQDGAVMLAGKFFTRPDVKLVHLPIFIDWAMENIAMDVSVRSQPNKVSILKSLAQLFKHGKREDMEKLSGNILKSLIKLNTIESENMLIRKITLKVIQRIGLTYLHSRVATWRYNRGSRSLTANLALENHTQALPAVEQEPEDEEEYEVPEEIEEIFEFLLKGLRDITTHIRWCAAKGVGRVCGRLPKELADDVIGSVIDLYGDREGDQSWHGACLALAELGRRGLLVPGHLNQVMPLVLKALVYDELKGNFSVGTNIRDAACYICWAFARAYDSHILKSYVQGIAEGLLITAVFDREITCRKAAAAAFQENVGRQGTFPHGIEIMTIVDYFSVALRQNAYLHISILVAQFPEYTEPLARHLIDLKVSHWDPEVRVLASQSLHKLTPLCEDFMASKALPSLLKFAASSDLVSRHGAILAICEIVEALGSNLSKYAGKETIEAVRNIAFDLHKRKLFKGLGADLMRSSMCIFIQKMSKSLFLGKDDWEAIDLWKEILIDCLINVDPKLRMEATLALSQLCYDYYILDESRNSALLNQCLEGLQSYQESTVCGFASALGYFPIPLLKTRLEELYERLLDCTKIKKEDQRPWVQVRSEAISSLVRIAKGLGCESLPVEWIQPLFQCFFDSMGDYTTNSRGDIGLFVRISAISALKDFTLMLVHSGSSSHLTPELVSEMFCSILKVSVEKIDKVSLVAGQFLMAVLYSSVEVPNIPHREKLLELLPLSTMEKVHWGKCEESFPVLVQLLLEPAYTYHLLLGFTITIGCDIEYFVNCTRNCLLTHLTTIKSEKGKLAHIENTFLKLLSDQVKTHRFVVSALNMADFLLSSGLFDDTDPQKFPLDVLKIGWEVTKKTKDVHKVIAMIDVLCDLINFEGTCRVKSLSSLSIWLCHLYPRVRTVTAQKLYESLVASVDVVPDENLDELLSILSETNWSFADREILKPSRNKICTLLGIASPAIIATPTI